MDKPRVVDVKDEASKEPVEEELPLHERKPRVVVESQGESKVVSVRDVVEVPVTPEVKLPSEEPARKEELPVSLPAEKTEPVPFSGPGLERRDGVAQPPSARPVEIIQSSSPQIPLAGKTPPWVARTQKKPTVREVVDLAALTPPERDVIQEYRNQASREILPNAPEAGKPLTLEGERERAKRLAQDIAGKKKETSFFSKIKKRLFG